MAFWAISACVEKAENANLKEKVESYAVVEISSPLYDALSENDKKIVGLFREAAEIMDGLFWKQTFGDKAEIEAKADVNVISAKELANELIESWAIWG